MYDNLDYRFADRKPKRPAARVRIKFVTVRSQPDPIQFTSLGSTRSQSFRENGVYVIANMRLTEVDVDWWGASRAKYERVA